jgi:polyisoprenoid-binding protein YceI
MIGLLALDACQSPSTKPPVASKPPSGAQAVPTALTHYRIQSSSLLHIMVYRGGPLARLGHNHVMSSHDVQGTIDFDPQLSRSNISIVLPVDSLIVDDTEARAQEGEDFSASVPDDARQGTRKNMLRADVLDAERYPHITLQSLRVEGTATAPTVTLQVTLKSVTKEIVMPVQVTFDSKSLTASGEFTIKQTDFGITPFSIGMGALQVKDELRIRFRIDAVAN